MAYDLRVKILKFESFPEKDKIFYLPQDDFTWAAFTIHDDDKEE